MNFARRLTEVRKKQGLSMRKLAERSGLSQSFISSIESGQKQPSLDSLLKLADGLGITLIELLDGEPAANSLPANLQDLLANARRLNPKQLEALNKFINSMLEKI